MITFCMNGPALLVYLLVLALGFGVLVYLLWQIFMLAAGPILVLVGIFVVLSILASLSN